MKTRIFSFDMLRIVGAVFVLFTHISAYIIINFSNGSHGELMCGNTIQLLVYAANPIFLMLSGALFLQEKRAEEGFYFYKRSWLQIVIITIIWALIYAFFYAVILPLLENRNPDFKIFINYFFLLKGSDYPHIWYLYMLIGVYLIIPILRLFVKKENVKYIIAFIIVSIIAQFIPEYIKPILSNYGFKFEEIVKLFYLQPFMGYTTYLLLGWLIVNFEIKKSVRIIVYFIAILLGIFNFIGLKNGVIVRLAIFSSFSISSLIWGFAVFMAIYYFYKDKSVKTKMVEEMAKLSFGVYALHVLFLEIFVRYILPYEHFTLKKPVLYIVITFVIVGGLSLLISFIFSRIKGLKYIIRYKK